MNGQFISAAGTYYVMSQLAMNEIHASCTFGNAPNIDVLASSVDGAKSIAIQVKSSEYARRWRGRGGEEIVDHLEWDLGRNAAKKSLENLFFAFVDLEGDDDYPNVYIIPSNFIYDFCKKWVDEVSRVRFHPSVVEVEQFKDNWALLKNALTKEK